MEALEIFQAGKRPDSKGRVIDFTAADLKAACDAYDPKLSEAPLVIGHPTQDAPAWGWVNSLSFSESKALAVPHQVDATFAEMVNAGRFKKISASFYMPDAPANPKPGVYYLRHVGFLGAQPPAVKGLKSASFAEADEGVIEFSDYTGTLVARLFRRMRDAWISEKGLEAADQAIPAWDVEALEQAAAGDNKSPAYTEPSTEDDAMKTKEQEIAEREAALEADRKAHDLKTAQFAEREANLKQEEDARTLASIKTQVAAIVTAGKLLPKDQEGAVAFAASLPADTTVEFGEGDKKVVKAPRAWFMEFLEAMPKVVDFGERGQGQGAIDQQDPLAIAALAVEYQEEQRKAGREISTTAAVTHVTQKARK